MSASWTVKGKGDPDTTIHARDREEALVALFRSGKYNHLIMHWWFNPFHMEGYKRRLEFERKHSAFTENFQKSLEHTGRGVALRWEVDESAMDRFLDVVPADQVAACTEHILGMFEIRLVPSTTCK